jgi:hypothetical protein
VEEQWIGGDWGDDARGGPEEAQMVNLGKLAKQAKGLADKQGDKIAKVVDKATDLVDDKTKGKYKDKLSKVDEMAKKLDKTKKGPHAPGPPDGADGG